MSHSSNHASYMDMIFDLSHRQRTINAFKTLFFDYPELLNYKFVGTGTSGSVMLGILAGLFPTLSVAVIRKETDTSNHGYKTEGLWDDGYPTKEFVFLDDLIDRGNTAKRVLKRLPQGAKCKGVILYNQKFYIETGLSRISAIFGNETNCFTLGRDYSKFERKTSPVISNDDRYLYS